MENRGEKVLKPFIEQADYMNDRVKSGIEQNRKGWFTLKVTDAEGKAVPGARIELKQKNHEFRVGANLFLLDEMANEDGTVTGELGYRGPNVTMGYALCREDLMKDDEFMSGKSAHRGGETESSF